MGNICNPPNKLSTIQQQQSHTRRQSHQFTGYFTQQNSHLEFNIFGTTTRHGTFQDDTQSTTSSLPVLPGTPPVAGASTWAWNSPSGATHYDTKGGARDRSTHPMMKSTSLTSILSGASAGAPSVGELATREGMHATLTRSSSRGNISTIGSSTRRRGSLNRQQLKDTTSPPARHNPFSKSNIHFSISPSSLRPSHFPSNGNGGVTYYDDSASLQKYLMLRSFLPNTNLIPSQMPDLTIIKDVALLVIRIDGLGALMRHCLRYMDNAANLPQSAENGKEAHVSFSTDNISSPAQHPASILFHDTLSQYIQRIVRIIVAEHGGILEKITGDEITCIFRPVEDEMSILEQSVGIHGSPHAFNKQHRFASQNTNNQALQRMTESCRRAAQCGYFLQQKEGKFEYDTSISKEDPIALTIRCAVGVGTSTVSTVGGSHSTWSRLMRNEAFKQIVPLIERRKETFETFKAFGNSVDSIDSLSSPAFGTLVEEDTDTPESPSNSSGPQQRGASSHASTKFSSDSPFTPLTRSSFMFSSFHSKPKDELLGSCVVSEQVRTLIHNYCTCVKITVPTAPDTTYFKIAGIKDWLPLPEEMKDESSSTRLIPVPEETLRLYAPEEYRNLIDSIYRNPQYVHAFSYSSPSMFGDESRSPNFPTPPPLGALQHTAIIIMRYEYLRPEDDQFVQFQILQELFCVIQQMVHSEQHSVLLNALHNESGTMLVAAFTESPEEWDRHMYQSHKTSTFTRDTCPELRAVRVALRIQRLVQSMNDARIQLNIGISSGMCFLGAVGNGMRRDLVFLGEAVQRAEDLTQFRSNNRDQVLCDSTIFDCTSNRVRCTHLCCESNSFASLDKLRICVKDSYHIYAAKDVLPDASLLRPINPNDRACFQRETDLIENALRTFAAHGASCSLVIQGAQGSGKTELARRLMHLAGPMESAPRTCVLSCLRREKHTPHFLLRLLLLLYISDMSNASLDKRKSYLVHLLRNKPEYEPYMELWNSVFNVDFPATELSIDLSQSNRFKKLHHMVHHFFLTPFLKDSPTVFLIEDYQNIDDESKLFLLYLQNQKIDNLFLCVTQVTEGDNTTAKMVSELAPNHLIQLNPLSQDETNQMVASLWINEWELFNNEPPTGISTPDQVQLTTELSQNLFEETEGSPFLVEQILLLYAEWGIAKLLPIQLGHTTPGTSTHLLQFVSPEKLDEIHNSSDCFALRMQELPTLANRILNVACVICSFGYVVNLAFLCSFIAHDDVSDIIAGLNLLVKRKYLAEYDPFEHIYVFASDFLCMTIYDMMTLDQQQVLHMELATAREAQHRLSKNQAYVDEITFHLSRALFKDDEATTPQLERVIRFIQLSIENRKLTREFKRVHELYELLISFMNRLDKSTQRDAALSHAYLQAARTAQTISPTPVSVKPYIQLAVDVCPKSSTDDMFTALEELWFYEYSHGERIWENWWNLVQKLLRIAKKTQKPLHLVESNKCAAITLFTFNKYDKMDEYTQKLLAAYRRDPDGVNAVVTGQNNRPNSAMQVCCLTARADWFLGRLKNAHLMYCTAREISAKVTHPVSRSLFLIFACYYLFFVRRASQLKQLAEEALQLSEIHDYTLHKYIAMAYHGYARFLLGHKDEGLVELQQGLEGHVVYGAITPQLSLMYISALMERGSIEDWKLAMEWITRGLDNVDAQNTHSYNFDSELWRLRGHAKRQEKPTSKSVLKYFVKAFEVEKNTSKSPMLEVRALLDIIDVCEENLRPSANDAMSTSSSRQDAIWKQKLDKYMSTLRTLRKQIMNEPLSKENASSVHMQSYIEPEEIQAMNRVVQRK